MSDTIDEKLTAFAKTIVLFPSYEKAIKKILHSVHTSTVRGAPSSALLLGDSGTGKSTICEHLLDIIGQPTDALETHGEFQKVPILLCPIPADCTINKLSIKILDQLGGIEKNTRDQILESRIIARLKTCQVEVIIFDEFHHLLERGADKSREKLCNWVKNLMNSTLIPIILAGTPKCEEIINKHPQLARRYPYRVRLKNLGYNSEFKALFTTLIGEMVKIGTLHTDSFIMGEQALRTFYVISGGNLDALCILLFEIFKRSLNNTDCNLTRECCVDAFDELDIPCCFPTQDNPFTLDSHAIHNLMSKPPC